MLLMLLILGYVPVVRVEQPWRYATYEDIRRTRRLNK